MTAVDQTQKIAEKEIKLPKTLVAFDFNVYSSHFSVTSLYKAIVVLEHMLHLVGSTDLYIISRLLDWINMLALTNPT